MRRGGFTLIEVMAAIVITSVVALLVYGTLRTGLDTRERLDRFQQTTQAHTLVRALLADALRNLPEEGGAAMNDMLFVLEDRTNNAGLPSDAVSFVTRTSWAITITPTEAGVLVRATPAGSRVAAPIETVLPDTRGLNVHVLRRVDDSEWSDFWDLPGRVPAAIALDFLDERGTPSAPRLVIRAAVESAP